MAKYTQMNQNQNKWNRNPNGTNLIIEVTWHTVVADLSKGCQICSKSSTFIPTEVYSRAPPVLGQINLTQGMSPFNGAEHTSPFCIWVSGSIKMELCLLKQVNREEPHSQASSIRPHIELLVPGASWPAHTCTYQYSLTLIHSFRKYLKNIIVANYLFDKNYLNISEEMLQLWHRPTGSNLLDKHWPPSSIVTSSVAVCLKVSHKPGKRKQNK